MRSDGLMMRFSKTASLVLKRRISLGLTQVELAKKVGTHIQFISNIERGICGVPKTRAKNFARALGVPSLIIARTMSMDFFQDYVKQQPGGEL